jgi:hypothetical protein
MTWEPAESPPQTDSDLHGTSGLGTGDGKGLKAVETSLGRIGGLILNDGYNAVCLINSDKQESRWRSGSLNLLLAATGGLFVSLF